LGGRFVATARARRQELIIRADRQVPHGVVVQIMTRALEAGVPSIQIATRPEPGEPRPGPEPPR
jgi:biopolymer transport protein ExbD